VGRYIARRLLFSIPTLLVLSFCIFVLVSVAPGDPAEELARRTAPGGHVTEADLAEAREALRLNRPFVNQYASWLLGAVQGDFGTSFVTQKSVSSEIGARVRATAELATVAFLLVVLAATPLGVLAALAHRRFADHAMRLLALVLASVPGFVLAYVLIIVFATKLRVFPVAGRAGPDTYVLPAIALAVGPLAVLSRLLRSSLLEVFTEDYMRTARGKGLSALQAAWRHGLRNAGIPVVTLMGGLLAGLLDGTLITEVIFAWPGLGRLMFEAISYRDHPMLLGVVVLAGAVYILMNLLVDVSYRLLDPRMRLEEVSDGVG
jgi:peptide/nickel transport system permease protein